MTSPTLPIWAQVRVFHDEAALVAKYVFTKEDAVCEAVLYRYPDYATRTVICCSAQSGCPIGCRFCGSGDFFVRSLRTPEIVAQIERCLADTGLPAAQIQKLQIMFMSMGEPMLNQRQVFVAIRQLYNRYPEAQLLLSTSAPRVDFEGLMRLSVEVPTVGLQFSIHESTDERRNQLIPFRAKYSLAQIAQIGERWAAATGRAPFINYCAHDQNNGPADAARLADLFDPGLWQATVSVVCERNEGLPQTNVHQKELATNFANKLAAVGFNTRTFDPAGQDTIGGGCGQLHFVQQWFGQHADLSRPSAGFAQPVTHTPHSKLA